MTPSSAVPGAAPAPRSPVRDQPLPVRVLLLAGLLLAMGVLHLVAPRPFDAIMPRGLPAEWRRPLTYASGVAEIASGALLLPRRTRRLGGWLAFATFAGVFPANVDAALRGGYPWDGPAGSAAAAWLRLPLQLPLLWLAWSIARGAAPLRRRAVAGSGPSGRR